MNIIFFWHHVFKSPTSKFKQIAYFVFNKLACLLGFNGARVRSEKRTSNTGCCQSQDQPWVATPQPTGEPVVPMWGFNKNSTEFILCTTFCMVENCTEKTSILNILAIKFCFLKKKIIQIGLEVISLE